MADVNINNLAIVVNSTAQGGVASLDCNGQDIGDVSGTVTRPNQPATKQYVDSSSGGITVIDNLTSTSTTDALSANQGRILNESIPAVIDNTSSTSTTDALSANQGNLLQQQIDAISGANSINNEIDIYRSITREDIRDVAKKYLNPNQRAVLEYLPKKDNQ